MILVFIMSLLFLVAIWFVYPFGILILNKITIKNYTNNEQGLELRNNINVSVIIAAHNEANNLVKRCKNILSQNYSGQIEIIIASDGSTDNTKEVVEGLKGEFDNIKFIDIQPQNGRSNAHNIACKQASYELLIFTDAETVFEDDCISNLVSPFSSSEVGFVSGVLKYFNQNDSKVTESVGLYWKFEMFLRKAESALGLYATGTGACCAVKKSLYKTIPATGDVDFITPLDVVLAGKKCIHSEKAVAWDKLPDSPKKEFAARVRMTSKNITGTFKRWGISGIYKHPIYSLSLFFHKIGRWLTPIFLILLFFSNIFLIDQGWGYFALMAGQLAFYMLGFLGFLGVQILYSSQVYSFLLANLGFLFGLIKAITGNVPYLYKPVGQQK